MKKYSKNSLERRKKEREGYSEFFTKETSLAKNKLCMNCGRKLRGHVSEIAHILPKSIFKSVATCPLAVLYLCSNYVYGSDGCHDIYDSGWSKAKEMKVWNVAIERYNEFKHLIEEDNSKILQHFK